MDSSKKLDISPPLMLLLLLSLTLTLLFVLLMLLSLKLLALLLMMLLLMLLLLIILFVMESDRQNVCLKRPTYLLPTSFHLNFVLFWVGEDREREKMFWKKTYRVANNRRRQNVHANAQNYRIWKCSNYHRRHNFNMQKNALCRIKRTKLMCLKMQRFSLKTQFKHPKKRDLNESGRIKNAATKMSL